MTERRDDDDDDDDDVYTFSGIPLKTTRAELSVRCAQVARLPLQIAHIPGVTPAPGQEVETTETAPRPPAMNTNVMITPYTPNSDPNVRRRRSLLALREARTMLEEETGQRHRLVRDEVTGMLLPRDQLVRIVAPPQGVSSASSAHSEAAETDAADAARHRDLTLEIVAAMRQQRLLRSLDGGL